MSRVRLCTSWSQRPEGRGFHAPGWLRCGPCGATPFPPRPERRGSSGVLDGGGDQDAEGVSRAPFVRVVERDEALNDGLPRDNVAQDDQLMRGVSQVSLAPLRTERVFECLCYHGRDLRVGCREMSCSTLSHLSEVTEKCPGRENQQILATMEIIQKADSPGFSGKISTY